jgi:hypothetical protein
MDCLLTYQLKNVHTTPAHALHAMRRDLVPDENWSLTSNTYMLCFIGEEYIYTPIELKLDLKCSFLYDTFQQRTSYFPYRVTFW